MRKQSKYSILEIVAKKPLLRDKDEEFFMHMFIWQTVPFFFRYDQKSITEICGHFSYRKFAPGEKPFEVGDPATHFFVIL